MFFKMVPLNWRIFIAFSEICASATTAHNAYLDNGEFWLDFLSRLVICVNADCMLYS